jgi:hypothetical protein
MFVKDSRPLKELSVMRRNSIRISGTAVLAAVGLLILTGPLARADWHGGGGGWHGGGGGWHGGGVWHGGGWHGGNWGWHGGRWSCCWQGGVFIGVAPPVYVPPPVYYPPPYYPPPYYAPYGYAYPGY